MRGSILLFKHQGKFILFCLTMMMCVLFSNVSRANNTPLVATHSLPGVFNNHKASSSLPLMSTALLIASTLVRSHIDISDLAPLDEILVNDHSIVTDEETGDAPSREFTVPLSYYEKPYTDKGELLPASDIDSLLQEQKRFYRQFIDLIKSYKASYRSIERVIPPHRIKAGPVYQKGVANEDSPKSEIVRREQEAHSFSENKNNQLDESYCEELEVTNVLLDNEEVIEIPVPSTRYSCLDFIQGIYTCGTGSSTLAHPTGSNVGQASYTAEPYELHYVICPNDSLNGRCGEILLASELDEHLQSECEYRVTTCPDCGTYVLAYQLDRHREKLSVGINPLDVPMKGVKYPCGLTN